MIGLLQRRRGILTSFVAICVFLLILHSTPWGNYARHQAFGTSNAASERTIQQEGHERDKHPWTRLIAGVDGFYVFENVYTRDRQLFMVPHPQDPPLPELKKIITSVVHENYTRDPEGFRPTPAERLYEGEDDHNGDYPQVPRLRILATAEDASKEIPGWGDMERYAEQDGSSWLARKSANRWLPFRRTVGKVQDPAVEVLDGMNWYLADDPAITGWGSLMHHYFHWMAEVLLGTYKAYVNSVYAPHIQPLDSDTTLESWNAAENNYSEDGTIESSIEDSSSVTGDDLRNALSAAEDDATIFASRKRDQMRTPMAKRGWLFSSGYKPSERDLEIRRQYLPMPKRVISPWGTNWEGRELNEMVLFKAFDNPQVYRRNQWRELSRDRKWRMFERVVITDRHAAHNDKSSQTEIWNKMALGILHESLPSELPHWFIAPQDSLTTSLSLPAVPLERRPSSSGTGYRSLADSFVKIVYVDRQNSDRRFDNVSHEGLMEVLEDLHEHGAKWNEREKADKAGKMKERKVKVKVDVVKFEHLNAKEQIAAVYDADIIIGVHGNGLTHIVWAKPGATVVEAFPVGTFIRDYELLSFALNHKYYTVWNDREYTKEEWIHNHGNIEAGKLHDGTDIALDPAFIKSLIKKAVKNMTL